MYRKLLIERNLVSRLARPPAIRAGEWYLAVTCAGCGRPIYLMSDHSRGAEKHPFVGEGKISTPCSRCGTDELYAPGAVTAIQSAENIPSKTPPRVEPSGMPRQPISTKYPKVKPTFGPGFLEDRPQAAAIVARCIALWTEVDVEQARLLAEMMRANSEPAIALFLTLRTSRAQLEALNAVAEVVLSEPDYELFGALMSYRESVEKERNALAHGCFGGSDQIESGVAWIDPRHLTQFGVKVRESGVTDESIAWLRERTFVYELADLETIARDTEDLRDQLGFFRGYLFSYHDGKPDGPAWRAQRYPQLCAAPRIAQALSLMRAGRKTTR